MAPGDRCQCANCTIVPGNKNRHTYKSVANGYYDPESEDMDIGFALIQSCHGDANKSNPQNDTEDDGPPCCPMCCKQRQHSQQSHQQPANSRHQPANSHQQPANSHQQPANSHQLPCNTPLSPSDLKRTPQSAMCGGCPPCPGKCNPNAPPTPLEEEVARLTIALANLQESFKFKVTECAILRTEGADMREKLEKEQIQMYELRLQNKELETKMDNIVNDTQKFLGTKEHLMEQELNMRTLKRCYKEAREEIDELRTLIKQQSEQIEEYKVKFLQAQQTVDEQVIQMDNMDMDNQRISDQINMEIQRVKLKFQEKLSELSPLPDMLKAAQTKLKEALQNKMIAEHNSQSLARELHVAREKIHSMMLSIKNAADKAPQTEKPVNSEAQQLSMLTSKNMVLQETNASLKNDVERLKAKIIRMENNQLGVERQLQDKLHECAQLGGEIDRIRDETARALARANERADTYKKCMQEQLAELERQLARSRAQVATHIKEKEILKKRMDMQLTEAKDNLDRAQKKLMDMQEKSLRRLDCDNDSDDACACHKFLTTETPT